MDCHERNKKQKESVGIVIIMYMPHDAGHHNLIGRSIYLEVNAVDSRSRRLKLCPGSLRVLGQTLYSGQLPVNLMLGGNTAMD